MDRPSLRGACLRGLLALGAGTACVAPSSAHAQRAFDVERFAPAPDGDGFLSIPGTRTPGPGRWNVALWLGHAERPLVARLADGRQVGLVGSRLGGDLLVQVGLLGRFALVVDAPFVAYQTGQPEVLDAGRPLTTTALSDLRLAVRARVLGEDATEERERHEGEGLALQLDGTLPVGATDAFAGEGSASLGGKVLADFHLLDFGVGGFVGYRHRFAEPQILGVRVRNELSMGLAVQAPLVFVDHTVAIAEVSAVTDAEAPFGAASTTAVEWLLGARGKVDDVELTLAAGSGLTDGIGTTAFRVLGGVSYAPRVHDRDRDAIEDGQDACPTLPEDLDGYLDADGCPEPDNDGDLVPDPDDRCPDLAAEAGRDLDDDGCNDPGSALAPSVAPPPVEPPVVAAPPVESPAVAPPAEAPVEPPSVASPSDGAAAADR